MYQYEESILDLKKLSNENNLDLAKLEFWLLKYDSLFKITEINYSCKIKKVLPCFCEHRNIDCLFFELYNELEIISTYSRDDHYLENELSKYEETKNDLIEVRNWLLKNEEFGVSKFVFFDSFPYFNDLIIKIPNGKTQNKRKSFEVVIDGNNFKNIYFFMHIFNNLFFEKKNSIDRYENWKEITGFKE